MEFMFEFTKAFAVFYFCGFALNLFIIWLTLTCSPTYSMRDIGWYGAFRISLEQWPIILLVFFRSLLLNGWRGTIR